MWNKETKLSEKNTEKNREPLWDSVDRQVVVCREARWGWEYHWGAWTAIEGVGSSCFDTHPAFPVTTSPHLPLRADRPALWELLPHPSLSSFKPGVRRWKEYLSEFTGKSLSRLSSIRSSLMILSLVASFCIPPLDLRYFTNFSEYYKAVNMSALKLRLYCYISDGRSVIWYIDSDSVSFSQESCVQWEWLVNQWAMETDTVSLQSCNNVQSVNGRGQGNAKRIDMHASPDTDDCLASRILWIMVWKCLKRQSWSGKDVWTKHFYHWTVWLKKIQCAQ